MKPALLSTGIRFYGCTSPHCPRPLIEADLLESVGEGGQVYFGKAVHLYGRAYAEANPLHRRCREALDRLATQHSATAQLCALRGRKYVVVDTRDGSGLFRITTDVGVEVPLPWTASGRLLLDHMSPSEIRAFVPVYPLAYHTVAPR